MTAVTNATSYDLAPPLLAADRRPWYRSAEAIVLLLVTAALLVPIWAFRYFPTTDGAEHLANADVLLHYFRADGAAYRQYYELNRQPVPNAMGHWLLAALMLVFPPLVAEKVMVSALALLLPQAVRYAVRAIRPANGFVAFLAVPLTFSYVFHQGFYNFCSSVVAFFFVFGWWLRRRDEMTIGRTFILFLMSVLLYCCHLFALNVAVLAIGLIGAWMTVAEWYSSRGIAPVIPTAPPVPRAGDTLEYAPPASRPPAALWRGFLSRCVLTGLAFGPVLLLARRFKFDARRHLGLFEKNRWMTLLRLDVLVAYRNVERYAAVVFVALVLGLCLFFVARKLARREFGKWDGLLLIPAAYAGLYFLYASPSADIYFIPIRLSLFFYFGLILWLAAQTYGPRLQVAVGACGIAIAASLAVLHAQSYAAFNPQITEFVSTLQKIDPQTTVLPVIFSPRGLPTASDPGSTVAPFYMAAGYVMAEKKAVDLRNYEAKEFYFPVRFRPALNPYDHLAINEQTPTGFTKGFDQIPQRFDLQRYTSTTGGQTDYVLLWAITPDLRDHQDTLATQRQLAAGYDLIDESPTRKAQLWRRKDYAKR